MLKAVISDISEVDPARRDLYVRSVNAPTAGRWILRVDAVDGFGLGDLKGLTATAERWQNRATKALIADKVNAALDAAGIDPAWRDDFAETLLGSVRLREDGDDVSVEVVDGQGIQRIGRGGAWMNVEGAVHDLRDRHPRCFGHNSGSQAPAGTSPASPATLFTGKSPFSKEHWNLTEQGKLFRENRPLYDRLKAEAEGVPAPAPKPATTPLSGAIPDFFRRGPTWNLQKQGELYRTDRARYDAVRAALDAE